MWVLTKLLFESSKGNPSPSIVFVAKENHQTYNFLALSKLSCTYRSYIFESQITSARENNFQQSWFSNV